MKDLLMLAKAFCLADGADVIGLAHFEQALGHVEITNEQAAAFLNRRFPNVAEQRANDIDALLEVARNTQTKLHLAEGLMPVLRRLEAFPADFFVLRGAPGKAPLSPALHRAKRMRDTLEREVFGQEAAIMALTSAAARQQAPGREGAGVAGLYLLAGPAGCGKSLAASLLAQGLGGDYHSFVYDMSALTNPNDECSLVGTQRNFQNSGPGELTRFVHENSRAVVVLEHIDKAHPNIQNTLFQVIDTGFLTDQYGLNEGERTTRVDFRSVHLVLVTDQGEAVHGRPGMLARLRAEGGEAQVRQALLQALAVTRNKNYANAAGPAFSPALMSRLESGVVAVFEPLDFASLRRIAQRGLARAMDTFGAVAGLQQGGFDEALLDLLVLGQARPDARRLSDTALYIQLFAPLEQRLIEEGRRPAKFSLVLPAPARQALADIRQKLGGNPIHALFRLNKRLACEVACRTVHGQVEIGFNRIRLERVSAADDFGGKGGLAIEVPETRFSDVAGHDELKAKLAGQVALLQDPAPLLAHDLAPARGMLLFGEPGTGKTLLARALAGEAGLPFAAVVATDFFDLEVLRNTFARLRKYAPAILFIDEVDALGRRGNNGTDPVVNTLLAEIDGFVRSEQPIFIIAATNFLAKVDPALLRPGRLELRFEVPSLDAGGRIRMLERLKPVADTVSLPRLARLSAGFTGAQMEAAIREAHIRALAGARKRLDEADLRDVFEIAALGEHQAVQRATPETIRHVAYHEAGHAIAMAVLSPGLRIESLSVRARGQSLGRIGIDSESVPNVPMNRQAIRDRLTVFMAGRAAEFLRFGELGLDYGAADDLLKATKLAYRAIAEFGLDPDLGPINLSEWKSDDMVLSSLHGLAEQRLHAWLKEAEAAAIALLAGHDEMLTRVAEALAAEEMIDGDRFLDLLAPPARLASVA